MKQEFEMTQEEMDGIIKINKDGNPPMIMLQCGTPRSMQDKVNDYWDGLGKKYGFKRETVEASSRGKLFFLAEPTPPPKTQDEIEMDKFDTLQKIIEQLESCYTGDSITLSGNIGMNIAFQSLRRMANMPNKKESS